MNTDTLTDMVNRVAEAVRRNEGITFDAEETALLGLLIVAGVGQLPRGEES